MTSQRPDPSVSYVNQVPNSTSPCCAKLMPQPDSTPPGDAHHRPCAFTLATGSVAGGGLEGGGFDGGGGGAAPPSSIVTCGPTTYTRPVVGFTATARAPAGIPARV